MKKVLAFILTLVMVMSTLTMLPLSVSAVEAPTPKALTGAQEPPKEGDTYLISTPQHLLWMAEQLQGSDDKAAVGTDTVTVVKKLEGKFKQTQDIDLGGYVVPSIGYQVVVPGAFKWFERKETNSSSTAKYAMFAGTYDGQGYAIENGYVGSVVLGGDGLTTRDVDTYYFGTGLFGVIYNATIKNVNLKNVSLYRSADADVTNTGLLVGMSVAKYQENNGETFNQIINCTTDSDCKLNVTGIVGRSSSYSNVDATSIYRVGGIIGSANSCSIINCVNNAEITVDDFAGAVGGIAASVADVTMRNCTNNGNINITSADTATHLEGGTYLAWRSIGGIAGMLDRCDSSTADYVYNDATITNCQNTGNMVMSTDTAAAAVASPYALGGIVGMTRRMRVGNTLVMNGCQNYGTFTTPEAMASGAYRAEGAIIGVVSIDTAKVDGTGTGSVALNNCASVEITTKVSTEAITDSKYAATTGLYLKPAKSGDIALYSAYNGTVTIAAENTKPVYDCITATAVNTTLVKAKFDDMRANCDLGVQQKTGENTYRFLATIDGENWTDAGFVITLIKADGTTGTKTVNVTKCYNSVMEGTTPTTAPNGRKYICVVVDGIEDTWSYEVSAFVADSTGTYSTATKSGTFG